MLVSTTDTIDGRRVKQYLGVVTGEAILGGYFIKDFLANITEVIGGRSGAYERSLSKGKDIALREMTEAAQKLGGNAVIGVDLEYASIELGEDRGSMLMVTANGTAVVLE
jgi:uncharacterized protein YbjQ (UPF0145 family)